MTPGHWLLACGVLLIAGCTERDPYLRTDVWRPKGVNAGNIAAMAANPADLIAGRGSVRHDTRSSTVAIDHVWAGEAMPLSHAGGSAQGGGPSPGAPGGAGGGSPATPPGN